MTANYFNDAKDGEKYAKYAIEKINQIFNWNLEKNKDIKGIDYIEREQNFSVEIKSEKFTDKRNIFIEVISNTNKETIGGPFRTLQEDENAFYVDFFVYSDVAYIFKVKTLCDVLLGDNFNGLIYEYLYREKHIQNKGYFTMGYPLPLKELLDRMPRDSYLIIDFKTNQII